jgi:hypothetical protein
VKPYEFEDIVTTLNGGRARLKAFENRCAGWRRAAAHGLPRRLVLVYGFEANGQESTETEDKSLDLTSSLGLLLKDDGTVTDVIPLKPADKAGVAPGMKLVAVNGRRWTADILRTAIAGTKDGNGKLDLLFENSDYFETIRISYTQGEKYPKLERVSTSRDLLSDILKAKTQTKPPK